MAPIVPLLRVAIFASSRLQPRALVEAFARITESAFAEIVLIATRGGQPAGPPWLWRAYRHMDDWAFGRRPGTSENIDLLALVHCQHRLPIPEGDADSPPVTTWRAEVEELKLDVAFMLGEINPDVIVGTARYGIWQLDLGEHPALSNSQEGMREAIEQGDSGTDNLNTPQSVDKTQQRVQSGAPDMPRSNSRNRDKLLRRAAHLPGRALLALYRAHVAELSGASLRAQLLPYPDTEETSDNSLEPIHSLVNAGWRMARRGLQKLFYVDQWFIAFRFSDSASAPGDANPAPALGPFSCLVPPKDRLWSDPFPLLRDGRYFIFFEEFIFSEGKAHIAVIEVSRDGPCSAPIRVLEQPYHLSYPFLLETGGQLFMVPESGQNGTVELYVCEHFPDRWRLEKVLLHAEYCADASFFQADNLWWMFVNLGADNNDVDDALHLYYADHLDGQWLPHPSNPINADGRNARSAGRLYRQAGQLYRPAQIEVPLYGSGIAINKVMVLNRENYLEKEVDRIIPGPASDVLGIHTFNRAGALSVVDGFTRRHMGGKVIRQFELVQESARKPGHAST